MIKIYTSALIHRARKRIQEEDEDDHAARESKENDEALTIRY